MTITLIETNVVRCKDCKLRYTESCPMYHEEYTSYDVDGYWESDIIEYDNTDDDGFCDQGEQEERSNKVQLTYKSQLIAKTYGLEACINQIMEECGELIQAAAKWNRVNPKSKIVYDSPVTEDEAIEHLIEEMADVQAVICNLSYLLECSDKMFEIMDTKADRQLERIGAKNNVGN